MVNPATPTAQRPDLAASAALRSCPVIAVVRAPGPDLLPGVAQTLAEAGIRSIELTLTTPAVLPALEGLRRDLGREVELGVGTVTSVREAEAAIDAGANYLVTPTTVLDVISTGTTHGVPVIAGGLTPTELHAAWDAGAAAVKVFPASVVGADYVGHVRGPFPQMQMVPSGGVDTEAGIAWLRAGAVAISVGGPLLGDVFRSGDTRALRARAEELVAALAAVVPPGGVQ